LKKIIKITLAIFFAPAVVFAFKELALAAARAALSSGAAAVFTIGLIAYIPVHFFIFKFSRVYVLEHEVTHAITALFFGYKVKSITVNKSSGNVRLDDYNEAVVLAPYIVPLYFLLFAFAAALLIYFGFDGEWYRYGYSFILGFLLCFHFVHTVKTLTEAKQPDLKMAGGAVFSLVCVAFFNILFVFIFLALVQPESVSLTAVFKDTFINTLKLWEKVINYIVYLVIEIFKL